MEYSAAHSAPHEPHVKMTVPGLAIGALAIVAATVMMTTHMTTTSSSHAAVKFVSPRPLTTGRSAHIARAGPYGEEAGVLPPTGFLDPLGFGKKASADRLRWFREAELKHGRIAMLAAVGFLVNENPDLKGSLFPGSHPPALASGILGDHEFDLFWYTFFLGAGIAEASFFENMDSVLDWKLKTDYAVGDLGFDPLNLTPKDPAEFATKRTRELQNGRLAMLAIAGFNAQEMTDGKPIWPIHGLGKAADAADLDAHISKGLELVKEMGDVMAATTPHH